jgi:hypothetical protein
MPYQFTKHYTLEEARALLPRVRRWLELLQESRDKLTRCERKLGSATQPGCDTGGRLVNAWVRALVETGCLLMEFQQRQIQIKDLERGLLDFPALINGREVLICWEKSEADIGFWHDLDSGYSGREAL